jgi:hypothetical protein
MPFTRPLQTVDPAPRCDLFHKSQHPRIHTANPRNKKNWTLNQCTLKEKKPGKSMSAPWLWAGARR